MRMAIIGGSSDRSVIATAALALFVLLAPARSHSSGQTRLELIAQFESQLQAFSKTLFALPNAESANLIDSSTVDSACYRKLVFRASVPASLLTLYLRTIVSN